MFTYWPQLWPLVRGCRPNNWSTSSNKHTPCLLTDLSYGLWWGNVVPIIDHHPLITIQLVYWLTSAMASGEGMSSPILTTILHFANWQPKLLYSLHLKKILNIFNHYFISWFSLPTLPAPFKTVKFGHSMNWSYWNFMGKVYFSLKYEQTWSFQMESAHSVTIHAKKTFRI